MEPLIITATPNVCWLHPDVSYPKSPGEFATEAALCEARGASVLHMHAEADWVGSIRAVRQASNIVIQCGMSSLLIADRQEVFTEGADMISIMPTHHDEAFVEVDTHVLHPREELEEYARLSRESGVKLEFEIWHTGSIWNLQYLIDRNLLDPPFVTTLFFGWPGGAWSPPTVEEYLYRRRLMPPNAVLTVSVMGPEQLAIAACATAMGDHVRVGTEDYPYGRSGEYVPTHQLVQEIAEIARSMGRPIARPFEARRRLGISKRGESD